MSSPLFESRTITAAPAFRGLIVIRACGNAVYLPPEKIVDVVLEGDVLVFIGDFSRVERPSRVRVGPVDVEDARGLAAALASHLGLPRKPRNVSAARLVHARDGELVTVVGLRKAGPYRAASEFEELQLRGNAPNVDGVYRLTGFVDEPSDMENSRDAFPGSTLAVVSSEKLLGSEIFMGRSFAIDVGADRRWRVLVDGEPVPMTLLQIETSSGRDGEKVLHPRAAIDWITSPVMLEDGDGFEVRKIDGTWHAKRRVSESRVAIYNTVVSISLWFTLAFSSDLSTVDVTIDEYTDTSS